MPDESVVLEAVKADCSDEAEEGTTGEADESEDEDQQESRVLDAGSGCCCCCSDHFRGHKGHKPRLDK